MGTIEIKRVTSLDASWFDTVAADVFDARIDARRLTAYLAAPGHHMIVALHDGVVIGQCAAVVHRHPDKPTELYIDELGVTEKFRQRGIGRALIDSMLAWGGELGCDEWWVGTEHDNMPARGLYSSYGDDGDTIVMYAHDL